METKQVIGFANKFYTLWTIEKLPVYVTDSYGNNWLTGYNERFTYHKNVSIDLDKVKSLYPNLEIDDSLRGVTQSWTKENNQDLCPQIMKFGKYYKENLDELVNKDFNYVLWLVKNNCSYNANYAKNLSQIKAYFEKIENDKMQVEQNELRKFNEILQKGCIEFVPDKNLSLYENFAYISLDGVEFNFPSDMFIEYDYNGFTYGLPNVKGKGKRMKNKNVKFEFKPSDENFKVIVTNVIIS